MNRLLIALQPTDFTRTYSDFKNMIRSIADISDDCFLSPLTCIVATSRLPIEIGKDLLKVIDERDRLLVVPLTRERWFAHRMDSSDDCFNALP